MEDQLARLPLLCIDLITSYLCELDTVSNEYESLRTTIDIARDGLALWMTSTSVRDSMAVKVLNAIPNPTDTHVNPVSLVDKNTNNKLDKTWVQYMTHIKSNSYLPTISVLLLENNENPDILMKLPRTRIKTLRYLSNYFGSYASMINARNALMQRLKAEYDQRIVNIDYILREQNLPLFAKYCCKETVEYIEDIIPRRQVSDAVRSTKSDFNRIWHNRLQGTIYCLHAVQLKQYKSTGDYTADCVVCGNNCSRRFFNLEGCFIKKCPKNPEVDQDCEISLDNPSGKMESSTSVYICASCFRKNEKSFRNNDNNIATMSCECLFLMHVDCYSDMND